MCLCYSKLQQRASLFYFQSSKEAVRAGLLSPELISNMGSEYAHLFGKGFEKTEMEDEEDILIEHNGFNIGIQVYD